MMLPNEILIDILQRCEWNSLLKSRETCKLFWYITYPLILQEFKKKVLKYDKQYKTAKRDYDNFKRFFSEENIRYTSFIKCNINDINEASWYCTPFKELHLVCFLITLLYGNESVDWFIIRNIMKEISFKKWYKTLENPSSVIRFDIKTLVLVTFNRASTLCFTENFIQDLKRKSTVGYTIYVNIFSILQINLLLIGLQDLEILSTHFYNIKNNLMKFGDRIILNTFENIV